MAYELVNNGPATPHRVHAFLRLVARLENPERKEVFELLQPPVLGYEQQPLSDTLNAAMQLGFLSPLDAAKPNTLKLRPDALPLETVAEFRAQAQKRVLGVLLETEPNFLFNIFSAWYATQDERVLTYVPAEAATRFNEQVSLGRSERAFNTTKFSAWRTWSQFLGLCWPLRVPNLEEVQVPNAYVRLLPLLPALLPQPGKLTDLATFLRDLAATCPELDGGSLFEQCWQASRGAEARGNRISLMLSNALRQLHDSGAVELLYQGDAPAKWSLYRATGHQLQQVSHIRVRSS